jgi:hypothetical protein
MATERPNDLGERVIPAELEIGKKYYYKTYEGYIKLTITHTRYLANGEISVTSMLENGNIAGPVSLAPTVFNHFYQINPKPMQRVIGEVFVRKTPSISSAPGTAVNLVRKFLDVQPPKVPAVAEANSRRNRKRRSSRKNRNSRSNRSTRKH